jgi:hypothetical protein
MLRDLQRALVGAGSLPLAEPFITRFTVAKSNPVPRASRRNAASYVRLSWQLVYVKPWHCRQPK